MKLTTYVQEQLHTCSVACLRMVAEYYGLLHSEAELLPLCETTLDGTTPEALTEAARQLGLAARLHFDDPAILATTIRQQVPVIVYLGIPTPTFDIDIHAVVVSNLSDEQVTFIDPTDGQEHSQAKDTFFAQWQNAFHTAIVITRT
ncbi:MAG: C39 family peptidase [Blastocatellia bacterium]|nr:C39 family peptidase [Blastocatellia bacterium]